jgi:hypothetical protein
MTRLMIQLVAKRRGPPKRISTISPVAQSSIASRDPVSHTGQRFVDRGPQSPVPSEIDTASVTFYSALSSPISQKEYFLATDSMSPGPGGWVRIVIN